jgi:hypothetical protein
MKKIAVRRAGSVRLTGAASPLYGSCGGGVIARWGSRPRPSAQHGEEVFG